MPDWAVSYMIPIYKDGPSNYWGVSLSSCLGEFFLSILNERLTGLCIEKGILSDTELGFMKGNRCSDAHLLIHNLIDKYYHKYNSKMYSCFIDLSKAFDTVPRDILLRMLVSLVIFFVILLEVSIQTTRRTSNSMVKLPNLSL